MGTEIFESGFSTRVNDPNRGLVHPPESIGAPFDAPATLLADENSAFALLKGMLAALGLPAGSGFADINDNGRIYPDLIATLGSMTDEPATDPAEPNSAIALLKGIAATLGVPS